MTESNSETTNKDNHDDDKAVVLDESMIDPTVFNSEFARSTKSTKTTTTPEASAKSPKTLA